MTNASLEELGPVDYLVVEFPAGASNFTGDMATELLALVDSGMWESIGLVVGSRQLHMATDHTAPVFRPRAPVMTGSFHSAWPMTAAAKLAEGCQRSPGSDTHLRFVR
ncbi:MAG TPA: hypothetical protein VFC03_15360 [Acidimicrobiales bacterium]|nr:hypothetical protein [Acidimicrobiales bacterium]